MKPLSFISFVVFMCLLSCKSDKTTGHDSKVLDFKYFTIQVPNGWERVEAKGIDSYVGEIHIDTGTIIRFDMGWYTNPMDEDKDNDRYSIKDGDIYIVDSSSTPQRTVLNYYAKADSVNLEKVRYNRIKWVTIDNHKAKLIVPKVAGNGRTAVYIDSLWRSGDGTDRFGLSALNLTSQQQEQLIAAIMTLKFCQYPEKRSIKE